MTETKGNFSKTQEQGQVEEWRAIPGFECYEVSNKGRVRNWRYRCRWEPRTRTRSEPRIINGWRQKGYLYVSLDGVKRRVHHVVLEAFIGPCPDGMVGCHNNGNPGDASLENLRWDTGRANQADRIVHGTDCRGEKCPNSVLVSSEVARIKRRIIAGEMLSHLAKEHCVTIQAISQIKRGFNWAHIEPQLNEAMKAMVPRQRSIRK